MAAKKATKATATKATLKKATTKKKAAPKKAIKPTFETVDAYIAALDNDRREPMERLRQLALENLPEGFEERIQYGMPSWSVPHSLFPAGYHCDPSLPLPFLSIASQKSHIGLYHMGIYAMPELLAWFQEQYPKHCSTKLDMGKSCIRFKNPKRIPWALLEELLQKVTPAQWIEVYEKR